MDWQQFRVATWNPALPSTLKRIPLSITHSQPRWCVLAARHVCTLFPTATAAAHTPNIQIQTCTHAHISSGKCQSVHHLSSCVFLNTMAPGFSHTAITLHSRRKRNESNTAVITRLLQRWIITSRWLPCLLKTYLSSNPFSWVLILHTKIRFFCFFPNTQTGVYSYSQSSNSHLNFVFMSMFVYTFIAQYFQLCQLSYDLSFWQTFDKKNHDSGTKKRKRKVIKTNFSIRCYCLSEWRFMPEHKHHQKGS